MKKAYKLPPKVRAYIGARIRKRRNHFRLSVKTLGGLVGKTPATVADWERGRISPSVLSLYRVASALNCTIYDFIPAKGPNLEIRKPKTAQSLPRARARNRTANR